MAIRIRIINRRWIAICAARSVEKPGDIYLDDGQHHALTIKFESDFADMGLLEMVSADAPELSLMEAEESNNVNRQAWDEIFSAPTALTNAEEEGRDD